MKNDFFNYELINQINPSLIKNYFSPVLDDYLKKYWKGNEKLNVLDVGCGNGKFSIYLKLNVSNCYLYGIDSNERALNDALEVGFDQVKIVNDFSTDQINIDQKFDLIICKDVLEHILFPENLVKNFSNLLKDEGHLIIAVPNHFSLYGRIKFLLTNNLDPWRYFPNNGRWNFPHIRFYTISDLNNLMNLYGFNQNHNFCNYFPSFFGGRFFPKNFLGKIAKMNPDQFSEALVLLFKKS